MMEISTAQALTELIEALVCELFPDAARVEKYGGVLFEAVAGDASSQVGGYFVYSAHMSVEFSHGAGFDDPAGLLEGKGKYRRHIKLREIADFNSKQLPLYLKQAFQV
jgi:hypothetical protein